MSGRQTAIVEDVSPVTRKEVPAYSWTVLLVLTLAYALNFLDRQVIYVLFTPIKAEMRFSDLQLALLGTTAFFVRVHHVSLAQVGTAAGILSVAAGVPVTIRLALLICPAACALAAVLLWLGKRAREINTAA